MKQAKVTEINSPEPKAQEPQPQQSAIMIREQPGAVDKAMSLDELRENLNFIRDVMRDVMKEGQDYGKVPGCGDKPGLFQPGAQKLCMTFQLTDEVKEERVVDLPNFHREYSFTVRLVSKSGRTWEGVGTCSTLESKYRYRKAERKCPKCGKSSIIAGKAEFGGGFVCWKKKGGCDAKFGQNDPAITSQPGGQVENENPPDCWNTVRKMAFKRALVHAAINATNTSELWSQDLEDLDQGRNRSESPQDEPEAGPGQSMPSRPPAAAPTPKPVTGTKPRFATPKWRDAMLGKLMAKPGEENRRVVTEYFQAIGQLLPNEQLEELQLRFVPCSEDEMRELASKITEFANGERAERAFPIHDDPPPVKTRHTSKPVEVPREDPKPKDSNQDEWFWDIIIPIPRKGQKRADYLENPDTIGSLFALRHEQTADAQEARQRLWGFVTNYEPKPWVKKDGTEVPPSPDDHKFREALDAFMEWFEENHPDEKL